MLSRLLRLRGPSPEPAVGARPRGLLDIYHFLISRNVLDFTIDRLAERGREGLEAFVLWGGRRVDPGRLQISGAIYPEQKAYDTEKGLLVAVNDDSLFEVNRFFHERGEILAAQVHTHPFRAFHSSTDDALPIVTIVGGLSVVIPNFAKYAEASRDDWAWYRLSAAARWDRLPKRVKVEFV